MSVKPIPKGYHSVTPYLVVQGATELIEFLKQAFDAQETERMQMPDGTIAHAEVRIGDSVVMMADQPGTDGSAHGFGPMPAMIYLYVNDADDAYKRALQAGATSLQEPTDQFYGDRRAGLSDKFGNVWYIATHTEDVAPEEMARRQQALMAQQA